MPLVRASWRLSEPAVLRESPPSLELRYCCRSWSSAVADLQERRSGSWRLRIDYLADCDSDTTIQLLGRRGGEGRVLVELPLYVVAPIMERCPLELQLHAGERLARAIRAMGG